ncbi:MAG: hypothetical protein ACD_2C00233G0006 [uncultured bacterium (gcode 4)]|uniref:DUF304 domain-containing protein n=1 Tax=uncultured bacterium (gcode 4) TaxID=1234023 RepID=K2G1L9_9BACT|nr:MAG: hypothetical protein ACD_2C00233G0006 [uncultured bacterium (gcode 4)]
MGFILQKDYVIIKKHGIVILYILAKFVFALLIVAWLFWVSYTQKSNIWAELVTYFLYPVQMIILIYAFLKLEQGFIFYYNDLVIFIHDKVIIMKSSLFLQDDLEVIDISKVMKIDVQCHWFLSNLIWYGNLVIEQQRDELRILHFVPKPYRALQLLREKTAYLNTNQDLNFFKLN